MIVRGLLIAAFVASVTMNAAAVFLAPSWWMIPTMFIGWYIADLVSGVVHMTMDYRHCPAGHGLSDLYFYTGSRESAEYQAMFRAAMAQLTPLQRLAYDFKNHHPRPDALGRRPLWRLIGSSVLIGALPASLLLNALWLAFGLPASAMAGGLALVIGGTFAQYFHASLHCSAVPPVIAVLRAAGLLMTPAAHARHHATLQRDFSTNCGWSNSLVNRLFQLGRRRGWLDDAGLEPHR